MVRVGVYIRKDISFNRRSDLDVITDFLESIFMELEQSNSSTIIGVMSVDDFFFLTLNSILDIVRKEKKTFYLLGDFNIDLTKIYRECAICK